MVSVLLLSCQPRTGDLVQVRGSDSEVNLVQRLGEAFGARRPDVAVAVTGGGSGVGIAGLLDGTCDLANSSRPIEPGEKLLAMRKGVVPVAKVFAADALTVIVNPANPVEKLTLDDLSRIYRGDQSAWPHGPDIIAFGRQSSSGTYTFFRDVVVRDDFATTIREMNGNAQIVEAVGREPGGIGYVAVGYLRAGARGVRAVSIAPSPAALGVEPLDAEAVARGDYPITRPLYQYTDGEPDGAVLDFLQFELSDEGRDLTLEMGFYPPIDAWLDTDGTRAP